MSLEGKNQDLKKRNDNLEKQVNDLRVRLIEKENELSSDELRLEYLDLIDEFKIIISNLRESQKEYDELIEEVMATEQELVKEMKQLKKEFFGRK